MKYDSEQLKNEVSMQKPKINLSVNPSYYCNLRCDFCYLTPEQLGDRTYMDLGVFETRLLEIMEHYEIGHIDIYGGEVLLLPPEYLLEMKDILHRYAIDDIVLISNLTLLNEITEDVDFDLSISYDFEAREMHERVLNNIFMLTRPYTILTLASRKFLDTVTVDRFVQTMNMLSGAKDVEIKPYSTNQANVHNVGFDEFERFVWAVINHPDREFYFENERQVKEAAEGLRNAFSDDHLYITPTGSFAVLEFDSDDNEFFLEVDGVSGYLEWCTEERKAVSNNSHCSSCNYMGHCLSEHLRDVQDLTHSCNGFKGLLDKWTNQSSSNTDNDWKSHLIYSEAADSPVPDA